jgi:chromosomal replication initiation ATPase DnaA
VTDHVALHIASYYLQLAYIDSGFEPRLIASRRRSQQLDETRRRLAEALRAAGLSLRQIGWALGGRHHTTVLHLLRRSRQ